MKILKFGQWSLNERKKPESRIIQKYDEYDLHVIILRKFED